LRQSIWSRADDDRIQLSPHFLESAVSAPVVRPRQRIAVGIEEQIRLGQSPGVVLGVTKAQFIERRWNQASNKFGVRILYRAPVIHILGVEKKAKGPGIFVAG
jgi:hypothetical protein